MTTEDIIITLVSAKVEQKSSGMQSTHGAKAVAG